MVVSEEKLRTLIDSIQEPIICDAMDLWNIHHSLDVLHAILDVHNNNIFSDNVDQQSVFLGLEAILAQASNRLNVICDKGMDDFKGAIDVLHEC